MKLSVRPNYFNDYYIEFCITGLAPPLLVSSFTGLCSLPNFCFFHVPQLNTLNYICHVWQLYNSPQITNHPILNIFSVIPQAIKYPIRTVLLKI